MKKVVFLISLFAALLITDAAMSQRSFGGVATRDTVTQATDYTYTVISDAGLVPQVYAGDFFLDRVSGIFGGKIYVYESLNNSWWVPIDTIAVAASGDKYVRVDYTTSDYAEHYWGLFTKYYKYVVNNDSVGKYVVSGLHAAYKLPAC